MTKKCALCKTEFYTTEFYKQKSAKDGLDPYHKQCRKDKNKEYAKKNRQRLNEYYREYYKKNKKNV